MTIAMNPARNRNYAASNAANVVPAAAVWDYEEPSAPRVRRSYQAASIRTVPLERATPFERSDGAVRGLRLTDRANEVEARGSRRQDIALGAVFGFAVFVGTLIAGQGVSDSPAPQSQVSRDTAAVVEYLPSVR